MTTEEVILDAARIVVDALLKLVPDKERAKELIDDAGVRRANAIADAAADAKFGPVTEKAGR